MPETLSAVFSMIITLILVVAVFVAAYFTSKFVGGHYQKFNFSGNSNLEILERRSIGKDQYLLIVKSGEKTMLLGATPQQITKIDDVEVDFSKYEQNANQNTSVNFVDVLKDMMKSKGSSEK